MRRVAACSASATTGAGGRNETATRHALTHVCIHSLVVRRHRGIGSGSSFDARNIGGTARSVNEMAIHISAPRAGPLLRRSRPRDGIISRSGRASSFSPCGRSGAKRRTRGVSPRGKLREMRARRHTPHPSRRYRGEPPSPTRGEGKWPHHIDAAARSGQMRSYSSPPTVFALISARI